MAQIKVKDVGASAEKYKTRGAAAAGDYAAGVRGSGPTWQQRTEASEDSYTQGVQQAIGRGAFRKGVAAAGAQHFESRAAGIGAQRFGPGIAAGAGAWSEGFQPYAEALRNLNVEPRAPRGDPRNMMIAQQVAERLRQVKLSRA